MGHLIVQMQSSIDGFVSSDDPLSNWQQWDWGPRWPWSSDLRAQFNELFASAGGLLLSRPMASEGYLEHWQRIAREHLRDPDYAFATRIGELPKIVISGKPLRQHRSKTTVLEGPFADAVRHAKEMISGNLICFGGASFVATLLREGLVDELQLYINPGLAGHGRRIFSEETGRPSFVLLDAIATDSGILIARWKPTLITTVERNV